MEFPATPSQTIYYEVHGEGPPLLLLHGFTGNTANWTHIVAMLRDNYRVITLDLPGHGQSSAPQDPAAYAMPTVATHIVALLQHLDAPRVHLLGYSMGGRLALYLALHFAHCWQSLILESASPGLADPRERQARKEQDEILARFIEEQDLTAFVDYWQAFPLFATQKNLPPERRDALRASRLRNHPRGLANSLRGMGTGVQPSLWQQLSHLSVRSLLIAGNLDPKFVAIAHEMVHLIPDADLTIISNAGHTVHLEQPEAYTTRIYSWLQENG